MKKIPALSLPAIVFAAFSVAAAQQTTLPGARPAAPLFTDAAWQSLLARMTSDTFADRDAAQKQLDTFTWRTLNELKTRAAAVTDPEAGARLAARVTAIEELMAYDPPPISLELKDTPFADVIIALEKATGEKLSDPSFIPNPNIAFTLSAKDRPFWEIFRDLHDQHPLTLLAGTRGLRIYQLDSGDFRPAQIIGPLVLFIHPIGGANGAGLQNNPNAFRLHYSVAVDPRVKIAKFQEPRLVEVRDNTGDFLLIPPARPGNLQAVLLPKWNGVSPTHVFTAEQQLSPSGNAGKTISAKGELALQIQLASESMDITDIDKKIGDVQSLAGQKFSIDQFTAAGTSIKFRISRITDRTQPQNDPPRRLYPAHRRRRPDRWRNRRRRQFRSEHELPQLSLARQNPPQRHNQNQRPHSPFRNQRPSLACKPAAVKQVVRIPEKAHERKSCRNRVDSDPGLGRLPKPGK